MVLFPHPQRVLVRQLSQASRGASCVDFVRRNRSHNEHFIPKLDQPLRLWSEGMSSQSHGLQD
jgi:hypothetical protein